MSVFPQQLPHRLVRDPSLRSELRQSIVFASVPLFIVAVAAWGWATDSAPVPQWLWFVAPIFALMTLGFVWNVVLKALRLLRGRSPVVEVDTQPWRPGETRQVRLVYPDSASLESLDVFLVAEGMEVKRVPLTAMFSSGWRFTEAVKYHKALLTLPRDVLRGSGPVNQIVSTVVPAEAAGNQWRWQILLVGRVARGVPREDRYPVRIDT